MPDERDALLVIGAGVSGLTTAVSLAEAGHPVRVRAEAPPQKTTSRAAGALWGSTFAGPAGKVGGWAAASLEVFSGLATQADTGVSMQTGTLASASGVAPPPEVFPGVDVAPGKAPGGFAAAFRIKVPVVDMPRYLDYLTGRLSGAGIEVELGAVRSLESAAREARIVVNCAGLGARELVPDPSVRPVRGQHLVLENPGLEEFFMTEPFGPTWTSWFPHGERVVLGGVAQEDDWDTQPRESDAAGILERCAAVEPRLRHARVVEHQVGLRPTRDVVRVEAEELDGARVVHNYGHGGTGVGLSWGSAREVVALIEAW